MCINKRSAIIKESTLRNAKMTNILSGMKLAKVTPLACFRFIDLTHLVSVAFGFN